MEKKKNNETIDEQFLISMMANERPNVAKPFMQSSEESISDKQPSLAAGSQEGNEVRKKRKQTTENYEDYFLKNSEDTARYGKTIYIRKEFHERVQRICQVIGDNRISLYSYIDNVLAHHFETYKEDIRQGYESKQKPII